MRDVESTKHEIFRERKCCGTQPYEEFIHMGTKVAMLPHSGVPGLHKAIAKKKIPEIMMDRPDLRFYLVRNQFRK
jgi:hypothetical protein